MGACLLVLIYVNSDHSEQYQFILRPLAVLAKHLRLRALLEILVLMQTG